MNTTRIHGSFCPLHGFQESHRLDECRPHREQCRVGVFTVTGEGHRIKRPCMESLIWRDDPSLW